MSRPIVGRVDCSEHGAMNKVSPDGMWRCPFCHIGFDEKKGIVDV